MKTYSLIGVIAIIFIIYSTSAAQTISVSKKSVQKTETIKVEGKCGMCKTRIENAAKVEGVEKAEWDSETKFLTLVFDTTKVSSDYIQKEIAAVGHDTEKYKSDQKTYNNLPGCCKCR